MAKFIFKMENILEVKRKLEDQAKSVYAAALAVLEEEQRKLRQLEEKKEGYKVRLTEMMCATLQVDQIKNLEDAVEVMKYRIQEQIKAERARQELQAAVVERKTYEKLKEKAFEEFKEEINAQEKKEVDELVSYKFSVPSE